MNSASGKRPPDEAHGPGKEGIRPQQLCLGESRKEGAHGHAALPAEVGTAQHSKFQPNFVKLFLIFSVLFSKFHWFFLKSCLQFTNFDQNSLEFQHFLRKRARAVRFSNFPRFRNGKFKLWIF